MPLLPLVGHQVQRKQIAGAVDRGALPQLLLLTGPQGTGKQRLALWVAQRLVCQEGPGEPCGICISCRKVLGLGHPDVHWYMPLPRPKATEHDKQVEEIQESLAEVLEMRRKDPLYGSPEGLAGHFVSTARLISRQAVLRPVEGRVKVFIIGHADRLVPQEASPEAANALLKLLEEPPVGTYFILTANDAEAVLPTIRSRAVRLRVGPVSDALVSQFLSEFAGVAGKGLATRTARAAGAIGCGLMADAEAAKGLHIAALLLESARSKSQGAWEVALKQTPFSARGEFTETLDAMAELLSQAARNDGLNRDIEKLAIVPRPRLAAAIERLGEAREMAQNNVNPQVLLAVLTQDLMEIL